MKNSVLSLCFAAALSFPFSGSPASAADGTSTPYPAYSASTQVSGELRSAGSDSMESLVRAWTDAYVQLQPGVKVDISSRGSAAAPSALLDGSANLGPMARPMKGSEINQFRARLGVEPIQVRTAMAAIGVYVSRSNPIQKLTLEQLDRIYSKTLRRGAEKAAQTWGDLGVTGEYASVPIKPLGRVTDGYLHDYFRQQVLLQGEFRDGLDVTSDARSTIEAVAANHGAVAFGEVVAGNKDVKLVPVSREASEAAVLPVEKELLSENYPLARYLSVYFVQMPNEPLDAVSKDFLTFVLSAEGQEVVKQQGLLPLPVTVLNEERSKIQR